MGIERINTEQFLELAKHHPVFDVRSPGEYNHAHIPSAYSLPLFTDEERAIVGTAYKQESREVAIKHGLDFFGPKMRRMVEEVESIVHNQKSRVKDSELTTHDSRLILLYCWRGGMRSGAVAWLMDLYGFKVYTLVGGYKKFRNYVLETFKFPFSFKILGGFTGSGKTEILKELKRTGDRVIDLEEIAKHKGSAFGNIGMPKQPTQEMFENLLNCELRKSSMVNDELSINDSPDSPFTPARRSFIEGGIHHSPLWLEDESQRIGLVNIPNDLWNTMRKSPVYFLDIPFDERLKHIVAEYGLLDKQKMTDAILRIRERLGGLEAKKAIEFLDQNNFIESFRILLKYYDKWYSKGLHNREGLNALLYTVKCDSVTPENANKLARQPLHYENP